jgi:hypothetical protein
MNKPAVPILIRGGNSTLCYAYRSWHTFEDKRVFLANVCPMRMIRDKSYRQEEELSGGAVWTSLRERCSFLYAVCVAKDLLLK